MAALEQQQPVVMVTGLVCRRREHGKKLLFFHLEAKRTVHLPLLVTGDLVTEKESQCKQHKSSVAVDNVLPVIEGKELGPVFQVVHSLRCYPEGTMSLKRFKCLTKLVMPNAFVRVRGRIGKTKTNETSLFAEDLVIVRVQPDPSAVVRLLCNTKTCAESATEKPELDEQGNEKSWLFDRKYCMNALGGGCGGRNSKGGLSQLQRSAPSTSNRCESVSEEENFVSSLQELLETHPSHFRKECTSIVRQLQGLPANRTRLRPMKIHEKDLHILEGKHANALRGCFDVFPSEPFHDPDPSNHCETTTKKPEKDKDKPLVGLLAALMRNIPTKDIEERNRREKYMREKKWPQILWMLEEVRKMLQIITERKEREKKRSEDEEPIHVIDIGAGRGDLALALALTFKDCRFVVIDVNEKSLCQGKDLARRLQIENIRFVLQDVKTIHVFLDTTFDLYIGLHACGGLTDAILEQALLQSVPASFLICTCCFGKNKSLRSDQFRAIMFDGKSSVADGDVHHKEDAEYEHVVCKLADSCAYEVSFKAMHLVNAGRLKVVRNTIVKDKGKGEDIQRDNNNICLGLKTFPKEWSPRNMVLYGMLH